MSPTRKALIGLTNSNGWFVTYFIIIRLWRMSSPTDKCIKVVAIKRQAMVGTVVGTMIEKPSPRIMLKMITIIMLWITKTSRACWKAFKTSSYSRLRSSTTLMFRALKAIVYVSFGVSRVTGGGGDDFSAVPRTRLYSPFSTCTRCLSFFYLLSYFKVNSASTRSTASLALSIAYSTDKESIFFCISCFYFCLDTYL